MISDDVAILFAALVIGGLALAALISMPVLELPDDDYPQGPFRCSRDDSGTTYIHDNSNRYYGDDQGHNPDNRLHHPAAYDEDTRC